MDSSSYSKMYKLVKKANRYEKQGLYNKELEIYELIHEKYLPNSSKLFKRPAILYEKNGDYEKSLEICKKAVELIEADKISGTKKTFEKKIEILNRKLNKKTKNSNPKNKKLLPKLSVGGLIFLICIIGLFYYAINKDNSYDNIQIDLSEMKSMNEASTAEVNNEPSDYPITEDMISMSRTIINSETDVVSSVVISDNSSVGLGILVKDTTTYSQSKKLATIFIKALGSAAASEYNLSPPLMTNHGELYNYYSVYVSVGTSSKSDDIILKAYKIKGANEINYK